MSRFTSSIRRGLAGVAATGLAVGLMGATAAPAGALTAEMPRLAPIDSTTQPGTSVEYHRVPDEMCTAMQEVDPKSDCLEAVETRVTSTSQRSSRGVQTLDATCRSFAQTRSNANGPTMWSFTQRGGYCYGGGRVWSTWHSCSETSGFWFSVQHTGCHNYKSGSRLTFHNTAKVSFVANGVPMHHTYRQWANVYPFGNIYYHTVYP